jgi:hypothetical protein
MSKAAPRSKEMNFFLLEGRQEEMEFVMKMRGGMGFPAVFGAECSLDFLLDLKKVMNIWRNGLAVKLVVEFAAMFLDHVFQPFIIMFLM